MSPQPPSELASPQAHAPLRILIVEDHPVISLALAAILEGLGEEVVGIAADGAAVRRHALEAIDLAFVDVNLADGPTGPAIATLLSESGVAVVFHTSAPGAIPAGFAHALGIMEKPSTPEGFFQVLQFIRSGATGEPPPALRPVRSLH